MFPNHSGEKNHEIMQMQEHCVTFVFVYVFYSEVFHDIIIS